LLDASLHLLGLLLLCSPIVHFWYLAWLLPFVAIRPSFGWSVASLTLAGYFSAWATLESSGWWGYGHVTATVIWLPVLVAMLIDWGRFLRRGRYNLIA